MRLFREAAPSRPSVRLAWTLAQSAALWTLALAVGPALVVAAERALGVGAVRVPGRRVGAAALFLTASGLNLATGATMALRGDGTPLPTACARQLVVAGPYAWVRNPMAVFGLSQGAAVAWRSGSAGVLAYVVAGGLVWHVAVRPAEEADLARRFGAPYRAYRRAVRCWVPRLRPYRPGR